jgi:hypothetical protein
MLDGVWPVGPAEKRRLFMFQPKARRVVPILALIAALFLAPLADASAAPARAVRQTPSLFHLLVIQLEAKVGSLWTSLQESIQGDAGPRMDDNGGS